VNSPSWRLCSIHSAYPTIKSHHKRTHRVRAVLRSRYARCGRRIAAGSDFWQIVSRET
jgi:hypothetical protein